VSKAHAMPVEVRLYDRLFTTASPDTDKEKDFMEFVNNDSLTVITAFAEPAMKSLQPEDTVQFQRKGYFCVDRDSTPDRLVFNRTVTLRDTWAKLEQ
jgi:glutaminyl-tRNA synthetase (EC 6.1.1.18)